MGLGGLFAIIDKRYRRRETVKSDKSVTIIDKSNEKVQAN
jgi:hypothetical protein